MSLTPDELLAQPLPKNIPAHQVTAAVIIIEHVNDDGKLQLTWRSSSPSWRTLGMVGSIAADCGRDFSEDMEDGDE